MLTFASISNTSAVIAMGVFLCLLPFFTVSQSNQTLALSIITGLLGFIGGAASRAPAASEQKDAPPAPLP